MQHGRATQSAALPSPSDPPEVIRDWLAGAHCSPEQARREWTRCGIALLPLGPRFDAVRIPGDLLHAAVGSGDVGDALNGPVIHDVRTLGPTYWALVPHQDGWPGEPETPLLSHGTYLGIPDLTVSGPPGSFWVTPPRRRHHLCRAEDVLALIAHGRRELGQQHTGKAEALRALARQLPSPDTLPDDRLRGRTCVWCGTPLTTETAFLDFGQLTTPQRWFPRACRPCTGERTKRADGPGGAEVNPTSEPPPSYITPACARCGHHFQPGEPYDVVPVESGTGIAPDAYRHREPCAPARRRR